MPFIRLHITQKDNETCSVDVVLQVEVSSRLTLVCVVCAFE